MMGDGYPALQQQEITIVLAARGPDAASDQVFWGKGQWKWGWVELEWVGVRGEV